jgi:hypothetical protein
MRTELKGRLGRTAAAIAVGIVALTGAAATADAQDWRYQNWRYNNWRYHHWNPSWHSWGVSSDYDPYHHRWHRDWAWRSPYYRYYPY